MTLLETIGWKKISSNIFYESYLSTFVVHSTIDAFIMVLMTFLKKKMLGPWITLVANFGHFLPFFLNVNFSHENNIFRI